MCCISAQAFCWQHTGSQHACLRSVGMSPPAGARQETRARNREALYALSKAFERAAAQCQKKGGGVPGSGSSAPGSGPAPLAAAAAAPPAGHAMEALAAAADSAVGNQQKKQKAPPLAATAAAPGLPASTPSRKAGAQVPMQDGAPSSGNAAAASDRGRARAHAARAALDAAAAGAAVEGPATVPEQHMQVFSTVHAGQTPGPKSSLKVNGTGGKRLSSAKKRKATDAAARGAAGMHAAVLANGDAGKAQQLRGGAAIGASGTAGASSASPAKKARTDYLWSPSYTVLVLNGS